MLDRAGQPRHAFRTMDESAFDTIAGRTLQHLAQRIEDAAGDAVEVELRGGILTLELDDGRQYVINKHGPNRQIWMSSPVSGATHYDWDAAAGAWRATRGQGALAETLAQELAGLTGAAIDLS